MQNVFIRYNLDRVFPKGENIACLKTSSNLGNIPISKLNPQPTLIFIWVSYYGSPIKCSTGEKIEPKFWDFEKKRIRKNHPAYMELNMILDDLELKVSKAMYELRLSGRIISIQEIKSVVRAIIQKEVHIRKPLSFLETLEKFISSKQGLVKPLTIRKYKSFHSLMLDFESTQKGKLSFDGIHMEFQDNFRKYLIQKGLLNNTINKYFDNLKSFMRWAEDMGYHKNTVYKQFRAKRDKTPVIHLTQEELVSIENLRAMKNTALHRVQQIFLFQCYTGQRYSDIQNLRHEDIIQDTYGWHWKVNQIKGNKATPIKVPLSNKAKVIIENFTRVKNNPLPTDFIFPRLSGVRINRLLKTLGKHSGITEPIKIQKYSGKDVVVFRKQKWECISTHTARRTFVSLALEKGIPTHVVMKTTGHQSFASLKAYINVSDQVLRSSFSTGFQQ